MTRKHYLLRFMLVAISGSLLTGCLFRQVTDSPRHYILSPISTNEPSTATTENISVGIGFVKMPTYLLQNSLAVRNDATEIEYIEDALWAERLDQGFQRTLAANLSRLMPSNSIYTTDWRHDQVMLEVYITVQQFDIDLRGRGTLVAQWRINTSSSQEPLKLGEVNLITGGDSPRGNAEAIPRTLSELTAEFSRRLEMEIRKAKQLGQ